jgi:hypothetical protein
MTAYVRKIGNKVCYTFPNGNFTMEEIEDTPDNIRLEIERVGFYEGDIPDSLYVAYLLCESEHVVE